MPGTTRTSSPRRESATRSETPSSAPRRSTRSSPAARAFDDAMADYQATRDEHVLPMFEFTCQLATLEPPPPEMQQLLGRRARQPGGDGRLRTRQRRSHLTGRVLLRRERRPHLRRGHALVGLVAHDGGTLSRERRRRAARVARLISPARPQAPAQALENVLPRQTEPTGHSGRMATAQHRWFSVAASVAMATTLTVLDAAPEAQAQGPAVSRLWTDLWTVPVRGYAATCHEVLP